MQIIPSNYLVAASIGDRKGPLFRCPRTADDGCLLHGCLPMVIAESLSTIQGLTPGAGASTPSGLPEAPYLERMER